MWWPWGKYGGRSEEVREKGVNSWKVKLGNLFSATKAPQRGCPDLS